MVYKRIMICMAHKDDEANLIHEAIKLASNLSAELSVLHINSASAGKTHMKMDYESLVTEKDLRDQIKKLGYEKEAEDISVHILTGSSLPKEIAKATENVDLLVIGHRKKNRFLSAFIDSVDKRVCDWVRCPILIVPRI
ncbi:universal stress protein [Bacteroidota bacterium]